MKSLSSITIAKPDFSFLFSIFLSTLIVFLQSGYSYYLSNQMLAVVLIFILVLISGPSVVVSKKLLFVFLSLPLFITLTALFLPLAISRNSPNIVLTVEAILVYAFLIICFININFKRVGLVLSVFRNTSSLVVLTLFLLIVITDSSLIGFLDRTVLQLQNSALITNNANLDILINDLAYRARSGEIPRLDLFYGESSYLAIVFFVCTVCFMLASRLMSDIYLYRGNSIASDKSYSNSVHYKIVVLLGGGCLLYVQSLSSIMYALLIFFYAISPVVFGRPSFSKLMLLAAFILISSLGFVDVFVDSYEYVAHRIETMQDSLSASQRFGSLLNFGVNEYLFGLRDVTKMPKEGFHNGLFYIIAISGFAGVFYIMFLLRSVYFLAKPLGMSWLLVLLVLALIMQNGAVFSPNKLVLFALILLPLACARVIYKKRIYRVEQVEGLGER